MHLIDKFNLKEDIINVTFKPLFNSPIMKFSFSPDIEIGFIINNYLAIEYGIEENRFFIVYAGKTLNPSNTLRD